MRTRQHSGRLVIVANRLPFSVVENNGTLTYKESPGGLVSALSAYLHPDAAKTNDAVDYLWVGWPGITVPESLRAEMCSQAERDFRSMPVFLSEEEMENFYHGFCNKTIWPLFHYFPSYVRYKEEYWQHYRRVNELFCETVASIVRPDDVVWVHDYHLMLLPGMLRKQLPTIPIGFFLHIPFPGFEVFRLLPGRWRRDILEGMLGADLNGFHTYEYTQHFLQSVVRILGHETQLGMITGPDRIVKAATFPLGIDFAKYAEEINAPEAKTESDNLRALLTRGKVILSVDRLDYSKGILNRLEGYEAFLHNNPHQRGNVILVMIVVPSRIGVDQYEAMKKNIEEMVGRINGIFGTMSWTPVVYQYRSLSFHPLVALYRASDVALVTPLRDGMNLVAKEYVAARNDGTGVLILSEMAGAAKELGEAIIINPNNIEEIADALREALEMPAEEQKRRNRILRERLRRYDVVRWATEFIQELRGMADIQTTFTAKVLPSTTKRKMLQDFASAEQRLLLLDHDGTLVPLARRPHLAQPGQEVLALVRSLSEDPRNSCVVVSGRDRETLQLWYSGIPVHLVAEHGIWIREAHQGWMMPHTYSNDWKQAILPILELYADRLPGAFVEQKEYSIAWHYRSADPDQSRQFVGEMLDHLVQYTAGLDVQVLRGHKVVEVRNAGANKGSASLHWLARREFDFILACGDDWTDEDMFGVLPKTAYSLRIGITSTRARYNLHDSPSLIRLLEQLSRQAVATALTTQDT
jgi:trehalose 6-phosphate synthase/phosphatase